LSKNINQSLHFPLLQALKLIPQQKRIQLLVQINREILSLNLANGGFQILSLKALYDLLQD
jgi:hypothetical protein